MLYWAVVFLIIALVAAVLDSVELPQRLRDCEIPLFRLCGGLRRPPGDGVHAASGPLLKRSRIRSAKPTS
jgi:hypothetical protein